MERAQNPWGINHEQRLAWADGLNVKTTDENPTPDVLYWVGCAASYDPVAQKTARAFVELLNHAEVNFAVLGKKECCTGDSARRAGNEYLYRQLADKNVDTLNTVQPKLIVASCPHCMNSIGHEYKQIGGDYKVMHHTEYLETLVANKKLTPAASEATITYHDPCYLGRHNGVYDAPRNLLNILSQTAVELPRNRENSFCCGAGGAQFWKEEEPGDERISDNRFREVEQTLASATGEKVLAVGCPFCKSMLGSTPSKAAPKPSPSRTSPNSSSKVSAEAKASPLRSRRRNPLRLPSSQLRSSLPSVFLQPQPTKSQLTRQSPHPSHPHLKQTHHRLKEKNGSRNLLPLLLFRRQLLKSNTSPQPGRPTDPGCRRTPSPRAQKMAAKIHPIPPPPPNRHRAQPLQSFNGSESTRLSVTGGRGKSAAVRATGPSVQDRVVHISEC